MYGIVLSRKRRNSIRSRAVAFIHPFSSDVSMSVRRRLLGLMAIPEAGPLLSLRLTAAQDMAATWGPRVREFIHDSKSERRIL